MGGDAAGAEVVAEGGLGGLGGAGEGVVVVGDGVVGDEGESRGLAGALAEAVDEVGEGVGVLGGVVVAVEEGEGEHGGEAGGEGVVDDGVEDLGEGVGAIDGHEVVASIRAGAGDREAEADAGGFAGEAADAGGEARGADGDGAGVDGEGGRLGEDGDRGEDAVEVGEGLAHALKDDAVDAGARGEAGADEADLLDDLPGLEVAAEAHATRGTEGAGEGAADLGGDADGVAARLLEGDPDGLDALAGAGVEENFQKGVDGALTLGEEGEGGEVGAGAERFEGEATHLGDRLAEEAVAVADDGGDDPAGLGEGEHGEVLDEGGRGEALEGVHGREANPKARAAATLAAMAGEELEMDPQVLVALAAARMPFGKYRGARLLDLPEPYLVWFAREGLPEGRLGEQMALMLEIKTNGLEGLVRRLVPRE